MEEKKENSGKYTALLTKLSNIQSELFVPKAQDNSFGGYKYRSCEDILVAVKPLCKKYGCVLTLGDAVPVEIGTRIYMMVNVTLSDFENGSYLSVKGYAREEETKRGMDGSQISGASISYARKYALASLFCIDNEKDSDATNKGEPADEKPKKPAAGKNNNGKLINKTQILAIQAELDRTGVSESVILDTIKKGKLEEMTQEEYVNIIARLNKTSNKE